MVSIKEISQIVGLSPTTVSNVVHGKKSKVSEINYRKIQAALKEHNYVSNMGGRILGRHGSKIIGVILSYSRRSEINVFSDPFYDQIIGSLEEEIRKRGYFMMLYTSGSVNESLQFVSAWNIEGLIILGALPDDAGKLIQERKTPLAFIDTYIDKKFETADFINIGLKDFEGGYQITKYLLSLGHRKIGFFADGVRLFGVDYERFAGFKQALQEAGSQFDSNDFFGLDYQLEPRHAFLKELAKDQLKNFTALVFTSDYLAVDAMNIFQDNGIRVPQDLSVTGFDHNVFSEQCRPKLTTIGQNVRQKAVLAIDHLFKRIKHEGKAVKVNQLLDVELVIQGSTKKR
ncbi:HTH-type transcriptional repressor CytR [Oenococcus sicerae]|nr:HTH-type transcriptional repressor CytR [Oenococcus sicerae]